MRAVCPYTRLHPLTEHSIEGLPIERVFLGGRDAAYWELLAELWVAGETFVVIEHDMEIHELVLPEFEACPEPWCAFPYEGPAAREVPPADRLLYRSLGCTKFGSDLLKAEPDLMASLPDRHWQRLDAEMAPRLMDLGYAAHVHWPAVLQHHVWNGRCVCGTSHEPFRVDEQGRYRP